MLRYFNITSNLAWSYLFRNDQVEINTLATEVCVQHFKKRLKNAGCKRLCWKLVCFKVCLFKQRRGKEPFLLPFHLKQIWQLTLRTVSPDSCSCGSSRSYGENSWTEQNQYTCAGYVIPIYTSWRAVYKQSSQCTLLMCDNISAFHLRKVFLFSLNFPSTISWH